VSGLLGVVGKREVGAGIGTLLIKAKLGELMKAPSPKESGAKKRQKKRVPTR